MFNFQHKYQQCSYSLLTVRPQLPHSFCNSFRNNKMKLSHCITASLLVQEPVLLLLLLLIIFLILSSPPLGFPTRRTVLPPLPSLILCSLPLKSLIRRMELLMDRLGTGSRFHSQKFTSTHPASHMTFTGLAMSISWIGPPTKPMVST